MSSNTIEKKVHHRLSVKPQPKVEAKKTEKPEEVKAPQDSVALSKEADTKKPTGDDINISGVTQTEDKVVRNQRVTEGYHQIARGLDETINPPGTPNGGVNWSAQATYASKKAGEAIQGKGLPPVGAEHVPDAISAGNTKVFNDIAPDMQDFSRTFSKDKKLDQAHFDEWSKRFEGTEGGDVKRDAFQAYYEARFETDQKKKQELVLLGNVKIGQYEQKLLDPDIKDAMAPHGVGAGVIDGVSTGISPVLAPTIGDGIRSGARQLGTRTMTLDYPDANGNPRSANLSQDVQNEPIDNLKTIDNPKLREALQKFNSNPDASNGGGSAASDWSDYDQRMRWIAQHFRSTSDNQSLLTENPQPGVTVDMPGQTPVYRDSPMPTSGNSYGAFMSSSQGRNMSMWAA